MDCKRFPLSVAVLQLGFMVVGPIDTNHAAARSGDMIERGFRKLDQRRVPPLPIAISGPGCAIDLRGWVNYFAIGHSSECLNFIKDWVEKKVRRRKAERLDMCCRSLLRNGYLFYLCSLKNPR
jgi:hypothetical protein